MSVCSTATGVLAMVAAVHITITIILAVLVAFILHYKNRTKIMKQRQQIEDTTRVMVAAGRTISPTNPTSGRKQEEHKEKDIESYEACGEVMVTPKKVAVENENKHGENYWTGRIKISADHADSEVVLRRERLDKSDPLRRIGSPIKRTESPLVRTGSPLMRTMSPIDEMRRKARASIISVVSNVSNRFRRSVDLNEEEVAKLVSMSTLDGSDSNSEEGILDDKVRDELEVDAIDNADNDDERGNVDELTIVDSRNNMHLKIDFPWEASESTC